jgi:threonine synthase
MNGVVEDASEEELAEAAARADRTGLYTCPHTAVALAAVEKLRAKGTIASHERVVVLSTASGLKFTEFKVRYHEGSIAGLSAAQKNAPIELPADFGAVVDALRG